jgi:molybdopterin converting factor small subunit
LLRRSSSPSGSRQHGVDLALSSAETTTEDRQDKKLKVRFYGKLTDLFGSEREVAVDTPCTVGELRRQLLAEVPHAAGSLQNKRVRACIGDTIVSDGDVVPTDEVLELLAPVSGG